MHRLPMRPGVFLAVYWSLLLVCIAPWFWRPQDHFETWFHGLNLWFTAISFIGGLWQAMWTWQVLRSATNRHPPSREGASCVRRVQLLACVAAPAYAVFFVVLI